MSIALRLIATAVFLAFIAGIIAAEDAAGPKTGEPVAADAPGIARGLVVRGLVRDAPGNPVAGVHLQGIDRNKHFSTVTGITDTQGHFELGGMSPNAGLQLFAISEAGIAEIAIPAGDFPLNKLRIEEVNLDLRPGVTLTGRVLHGQSPRPGVIVVLERLFSSSRNSAAVVRWFETVTDDSGAYRLYGLKAGDQYHVRLEDPDGMFDPRWRYFQLGVQTVPENRDKIKLPDAHLVTSSQSLRGVVVDRQGNPLAGITIFASTPNSRGYIQPSGGGSVKTDVNGAFVCDRLPDEAIELSAFSEKPSSRMARIQPDLGQQDIRLILDLSLEDENQIEDLDGSPTKPTK